jgi:molybdate transport system substrate-binding protein
LVVRAGFVVTVFVAFFAASCGGDKAEAPVDDPSVLRGDITVYAASSLTAAFKELGATFEAANPEVTVAFSFGASSTLATQINEGAPADVFASADDVQMDVVVKNGNVAKPETFASNTPVLVIPRGNGPVQSFADLAKPGVRLVLAAPEVPIGNYARQILANASIQGAVSLDFAARALGNLRSNEPNVRAALAKVQTGEADAAIVYATDVSTAAKDVDTIDIPPQYNVEASYPIAATTATKNGPIANAFVEFVLSPVGQSILQKYGFGPPTP